MEARRAGSNRLAKSNTAKHIQDAEVCAKHLSRPWQLSRVGGKGAGVDERRPKWATMRPPTRCRQGASPPGAYQPWHTVRVSDTHGTRADAEPDGAATWVVGEDAAPPPSTVDCRRRHSKRQSYWPPLGLTARPLRRTRQPCLSQIAGNQPRSREMWNTAN